MSTAFIAPLQRCDSSGRVIDLICNPVLPIAGRKRFQDGSLTSRRFGRERSRGSRVKFLSATCPVCIVVPSTRQAELEGVFHD